MPFVSMVDSNSKCTSSRELKARKTQRYSGRVCSAHHQPARRGPLCPTRTLHWKIASVSSYLSAWACAGQLPQVSGEAKPLFPVSCATTIWQAVIGYKDIGILLASPHIKPGRACTNAERLNTFNGLLLTPNLDRVFDAGLITFCEYGLILLSPLLSSPKQLGIKTGMQVTLANQQVPFMDFHRASEFRS